MSFDWMQARRRNSKVRTLRLLDMYRRELRGRAGVFYRLGYSLEHATLRLRDNVRWEFEVGGQPEGLDTGEIASIVERAYKRRPDHGGRI